MLYYGFTIVECTKPELVSLDSQFISESSSLLIFHDEGKARFMTKNGNMDDELIKFSLTHPAETIKSSFQWWYEDYFDIIFYFEYKNGTRREAGIRPEYKFYWS